MKLFLSMILLLLSFNCYSIDIRSLYGNWQCETETIEQQGITINVEHYLTYLLNGESIDKFVWVFDEPMELEFTVEYSGPWNIENGQLIEKGTSTQVTNISNTEILNKKAIDKILTNYPVGETYISDILELTKDKLVTKNIESQYIGTCFRIND